MFFNRTSSRHRIDCISLEQIPKRYDIIIGSSHHDARTLAEYMVSGGTMHPLSRNPFVPHDYLKVSRKVSGDLRETVLRKGCEMADSFISKTLAVIRAVNFFRVLCVDERHESLFLLLLVLDCLDTKANIGEYAQKLKETRFAHVLFASRPDVDPNRVHTVLESQTLQDKCDFVDEIECLLIDFENPFLQCMKSADMFALIDALRKYNVDTQYM